MVNKVILIGRLGKDPEVRRLESGVAVAKFSLATDESYKDKEGNQVQQTEWHNIVVWRTQAEVAEKYLKKGMLIYVEGKLTHREYTDKDNQKRYFTEVVANTFKMLERKDSGGSGYFPGADDDPASKTKTKDTEAAVVEDAGNAPTDDLPF
ncbi:MAG: single-stranded DNA-binding protein [Saprospiraceae bacterium]